MVFMRDFIINNIIQLFCKAGKLYDVELLQRNNSEALASDFLENPEEVLKNSHMKSSTSNINTNNKYTKEKTRNIF